MPRTYNAGRQKNSEVLDEGRARLSNCEAEAEMGSTVSLSERNSVVRSEREKPVAAKVLTGRRRTRAAHQLKTVGTVGVACFVS